MIELTENEKIIESDEFVEWVSDNKYDEFGGLDDNYQEDLERYLEGNAEELVNEYKDSLNKERDDDLSNDLARGLNL